MNTRPVVRTELRYKYLGFNLDLDLKTNLILISDKSGTGKSFLYDIIKSQSIGDDEVIGISYEEINNYKLVTLLDTFKQEKNKLFIIDNADIMLDTETRRYIAFDTKNQYVLIGRDSSDLMICNYNKARVIIDKDTKRIYLKYFG